MLADDDVGDAAENDVYLQMIDFKSLRAPDGLETAISVQWEGHVLLLSTLLEEDDLAPLFAGAQWAGTRVWHAAIAMVKYLVENYRNYLTRPDCQLLELGCGLGVPGMLCHALYHTKTYVTDQESLLSQLRKNIQHNFGDKSDLHAKALDWSCEAVRDLVLETGPFDICINCDCVYEPLYGDSWKRLADVMEELLRVKPTTVMLTCCERRNEDSIDNFRTKLEASEYISSVETVWTDLEFNIEIYLARGVIRQ
jgi:hypothetical protein